MRLLILTALAYTLTKGLVTEEICTTLLVDGGILERSVNSEIYGREEYKVTCLVGYDVEGSEYLTCNGGKVQGAVPQCVPSQERPPEPTPLPFPGQDKIQDNMNYDPSICTLINTATSLLANCSQVIKDSPLCLYIESLKHKVSEISGLDLSVVESLYRKVMEFLSSDGANPCSSLDPLIGIVLSVVEAMDATENPSPCILIDTTTSFIANCSNLVGQNPVCRYVEGLKYGVGDLLGLDDSIVKFLSTDVATPCHTLTALVSGFEIGRVVDKTSLCNLLNTVNSTFSNCSEILGDEMCYYVQSIDDTYLEAICDNNNDLYDVVQNIAQNPSPCNLIDTATSLLANCVARVGENPLCPYVENFKYSVGNILGLDDSIVEFLSTDLATPCNTLEPLIRIVMDVGKQPTVCNVIDSATMLLANCSDIIGDDILCLYFDSLKFGVRDILGLDSSVVELLSSDFSTPCNMLSAPIMTIIMALEEDPTPCGVIDTVTSIVANCMQVIGDEVLCPYIDAFKYGIGSILGLDSSIVEFLSTSVATPCYSGLQIYNNFAMTGVDPTPCGILDIINSTLENCVDILGDETLCFFVDSFAVEINVTYLEDLCDNTTQLYSIVNDIVNDPTSCSSVDTLILLITNCSDLIEEGLLCDNIQNLKYMFLDSVGLDFSVIEGFLSTAEPCSTLTPIMSLIMDVAAEPSPCSVIDTATSLLANCTGIIGENPVCLFLDAIKYGVGDILGLDVSIVEFLSTDFATPCNTLGPLIDLVTGVIENPSVCSVIDTPTSFLASCPDAIGDNIICPYVEAFKYGIGEVLGLESKAVEYLSSDVATPCNTLEPLVEVAMEVARNPSICSVIDTFTSTLSDCYRITGDAQVCSYVETFKYGIGDILGLDNSMVEALSSIATPCSTVSQLVNDLVMIIYDISANPEPCRILALLNSLLKEDCSLGNEELCYLSDFKFIDTFNVAESVELCQIIPSVCDFLQDIIRLNITCPELENYEQVQITAAHTLYLPTLLAKYVPRVLSDIKRVTLTLDCPLEPLFSYLSYSGPDSVFYGWQRGWQLLAWLDIGYGADWDNYYFQVATVTGLLNSAAEISKEYHLSCSSYSYSMLETPLLSQTLKLDYQFTDWFPRFEDNYDAEIRNHLISIGIDSFDLSNEYEYQEFKQWDTFLQDVFSTVVQVLPQFRYLGSTVDDPQTDRFVHQLQLDLFSKSEFNANIELYVTTAIEEYIKPFIANANKIKRSVAILYPEIIPPIFSRNLIFELKTVYEPVRPKVKLLNSEYLTPIQPLFSESDQDIYTDFDLVIYGEEICNDEGGVGLFRRSVWDMDFEQDYNCPSQGCIARFGNCFRESPNVTHVQWTVVGNVGKTPEWTVDDISAFTGARITAINLNVNTLSIESEEGEYSYAGSPLQCPLNTYQSLSDQRLCTSCPKGSYTVFPAATCADTCNQGAVQNGMLGFSAEVETCSVLRLLDVMKEKCDYLEMFQGGACSTLDTVQMLIRMEALDDEMIKRLLGDACKQITGLCELVSKMVNSDCASREVYHGQTMLIRGVPIPSELVSFIYPYLENLDQSGLELDFSSLEPLLAPVLSAMSYVQMAGPAVAGLVDESTIMLLSSALDLMRSAWGVMRSVELEGIAFTFEDKDTCNIHWSNWSNCNIVLCREDRYKCAESDAYSYADCDILQTESRACLDDRKCQYYPDDGSDDGESRIDDDTHWSNWTSCNSILCQENRYKCLDGGDPYTYYNCTDLVSETRACHNCNRATEDMYWSAWSECDVVSCNQDRVKCQDNSTEYTTCEGIQIQHRDCQDGSVCNNPSEWGEWSSCHKETCIKERERCANVVNGTDCEYEDLQSEQCQDLSQCDGFTKAEVYWETELNLRRKITEERQFILRIGVQTTPDEITELLRNSLKGMLDELNVFLGELYSNIDKEMLPLDIEYLGNNWFSSSVELWEEKIGITVHSNSSIAHYLDFALTLGFDWISDVARDLGLPVSFVLDKHYYPYCDVFASIKGRYELGCYETEKSHFEMYLSREDFSCANWDGRATMESVFTLNSEEVLAMLFEDCQLSEDCQLEYGKCSSSGNNTSISFSVIHQFDLEVQNITNLNKFSNLIDKVLYLPSSSFYPASRIINSVDIMRVETVECWAGEYRFGGECKKCPLGSYSPDGKGACRGCDKDGITIGIGAKSQDQCIDNVLSLPPDSYGALFGVIFNIIETTMLDGSVCGLRNAIQPLLFNCHELIDSVGVCNFVEDFKYYMLDTNITESVELCAEMPGVCQMAQSFILLNNTSSCNGDIVPVNISQEIVIDMPSEIGMFVPQAEQDLRQMFGCSLDSLFEYLYKPDTAYNGGMQQLQYLAWLGAMSWDDYDSLSSDVTGYLQVANRLSQALGLSCDNYEFDLARVRTPLLYTKASFDYTSSNWQPMVRENRNAEIRNHLISIGVESFDFGSETQLLKEVDDVIQSVLGIVVQILPQFDYLGSTMFDPQTNERFVHQLQLDLFAKSEVNYYIETYVTLAIEDWIKPAVAMFNEAKHGFLIIYPEIPEQFSSNVIVDLTTFYEPVCGRNCEDTFTDFEFIINGVELCGTDRGEQFFRRAVWGFDYEEDFNCSIAIGDKTCTGRWGLCHIKYAGVTHFHWTVVGENIKAPEWTLAEVNRWVGGNVDSFELLVDTINNRSDIGSYNYASSEKECPINTYQNLTNQPICKSCPYGSFTLESGSTCKDACLYGGSQEGQLTFTSSLNVCRFWDLFDMINIKCVDGDLSFIAEFDAICNSMDDIETLLKSDALVIELVGEMFGDICSQMPWVCNIISEIASSDCDNSSSISYNNINITLPVPSDVIKFVTPYIDYLDLYQPSFSVDSANFIVDPLLNVLEDYAAYFTPTIASTIGIEIDDMNIERLTKTVVELMKELWDIIDTVEVEDIGFSFSDKSDPCFEDVDWTEWSSCDNSVCEETRYKCADNFTDYPHGNCTDVIMETRVCEDDSFCDQDDDSWSDWGVCNNTECKQSRFKCSDNSTNYDSCDPEIEKKDCDNSTFCDQDDDAWSDWGVCNNTECKQSRFKCSDNSTNYDSCDPEIEKKDCDNSAFCDQDDDAWSDWGVCNNTECKQSRFKCSDNSTNYDSCDPEFEKKDCDNSTFCDQDDDAWSDWGVCNNTECKQSRFKCSDNSTNYDSCDPEIEKKDCDNSTFCDQDDDAWSDWGVCDGISCTQERYKCSDHSTNYTTCYKEIQTKVCDDDSVCYDEAGPWGSWGLCNNTVCTMNRHRCGDKECSYEEFDTKRCKDLSLCDGYTEVLSGVYWETELDLRNELIESRQLVLRIGVETTPDDITEMLRDGLKGMLDELNVFLGEFYSTIDREMLPLDIEYLGNNWFTSGERLWEEKIGINILSNSSIAYYADYYLTFGFDWISDVTKDLGLPVSFVLDKEYSPFCKVYTSPWEKLELGCVETNTSTFTMTLEKDDFSCQNWDGRATIESVFILRSAELLRMMFDCNECLLEYGECYSSDQNTYILFSVVHQDELIQQNIHNIAVFSNLIDEVLYLPSAEFYRGRIGYTFDISMILPARCYPGEARFGGVCRRCPLGSYSPDGEGPCIGCDKYGITLEIGATSLDQCIPEILDEITNPNLLNLVFDIVSNPSICNIAGITQRVLNDCPSFINNENLCAFISDIRYDLYNTNISQTAKFCHDIPETCQMLQTLLTLDEPCQGYQEMVNLTEILSVDMPSEVEIYIPAAREELRRMFGCPLDGLFKYLYKPDTAYNGGMQQLQYLAWLGAMSWDDYDSLSSDVTGVLKTVNSISYEFGLSCNSFDYSMANVYSPLLYKNANWDYQNKDWERMVRENYDANIRNHLVTIGVESFDFGGNERIIREVDDVIQSVLGILVQVLPQFDYLGSTMFDPQTDRFVHLLQLDLFSQSEVNYYIETYVTLAIEDWIKPAVAMFNEAKRGLVLTYPEIPQQFLSNVIVDLTTFYEPVCGRNCSDTYTDFELIIHGVEICGNKKGENFIKRKIWDLDFEEDFNCSIAIGEKTCTARYGLCHVHYADMTHIHWTMVGENIAVPDWSDDDIVRKVGWSIDSFELIVNSLSNASDIGSYSYASTETKCPVNTYQNRRDQKTCHACPEGSFTLDSGSTCRDACMYSGTQDGTLLFNSSINSCRFWNIFDTVKEKCGNGEFDYIELIDPICENIDDIQSLLKSEVLALELISEAFGDVCGDYPWICNIITDMLSDNCSDTYSGSTVNKMNFTFPVPSEAIAFVKPYIGYLSRYRPLLDFASADFIVDIALNILDDYAQLVTPTLAQLVLGIEDDNVVNLTKTAVDFIKDFWGVIDTARVWDIGFSYDNADLEACYIPFSDWDSCEYSTCHMTRTQCQDDQCIEVDKEEMLCEDPSVCTVACNGTQRIFYAEATVTCDGVAEFIGNHLNNDNCYMQFVTDSCSTTSSGVKFYYTGSIDDSQDTANSKPMMTKYISDQLMNVWDLDQLWEEDKAVKCPMSPSRFEAVGEAYYYKQYNQDFIGEAYACVNFALVEIQGDCESFIDGDLMTAKRNMTFYERDMYLGTHIDNSCRADRFTIGVQYSPTIDIMDYLPSLGMEFSMVTSETLVCEERFSYDEESRSCVLSVVYSYLLRTELPNTECSETGALIQKAFTGGNVTTVLDSCVYNASTSMSTVSLLVSDTTLSSEEYISTLSDVSTVSNTREVPAEEACPGDLAYADELVACVVAEYVYMLYTVENAECEDIDQILFDVAHRGADVQYLNGSCYEDLDNNNVEFYTYNTHTSVDVDDYIAETINGDVVNITDVEQEAILCPYNSSLSLDLINEGCVNELILWTVFKTDVCDGGELGLIAGLELSQGSEVFAVNETCDGGNVTVILRHYASLDGSNKTLAELAPSFLIETVEIQKADDVICLYGDKKYIEAHYMCMVTYDYFVSVRQGGGCKVLAVTVPLEEMDVDYELVTNTSTCNASTGESVYVIKLTETINSSIELIDEINTTAGIIDLTEVPEEDVCDWQSTYNDGLVSCEPVTRHVLYAQTTLDNCTVVEDWESTFAEEGVLPWYVYNSCSVVDSKVVFYIEVGLHRDSAKLADYMNTVLLVFDLDQLWEQAAVCPSGSLRRIQDRLMCAEVSILLVSTTEDVCSKLSPLEDLSVEYHDQSIIYGTCNTSYLAVYSYYRESVDSLITALEAFDNVTSVTEITASEVYCVQTDYQYRVADYTCVEVVPTTYYVKLGVNRTCDDVATTLSSSLSSYTFYVIDNTCTSGFIGTDVMVAFLNISTQDSTAWIRGLEGGGVLGTTLMTKDTVCGDVKTYVEKIKEEIFSCETPETLFLFAETALADCDTVDYQGYVDTLNYTTGQLVELMYVRGSCVELSNMVTLYIEVTYVNTDIDALKEEMLNPADVNNFTSLEVKASVNCTVGDFLRIEEVPGCAVFSLIELTSSLKLCDDPDTFVLGLTIDGGIQQYINNSCIFTEAASTSAIAVGITGHYRTLNLTEVNSGLVSFLITSSVEITAATVKCNTTLGDYDSTLRACLDIVCTAGTYADSASLTCIDCAKGTFSVGHQEVCTKCKYGTTLLPAAASSAECFSLAIDLPFIIRGKSSEILCGVWSERSSVTIAFTSTTTAFTATSDVVNTAESAKLADAASANKYASTVDSDDIDVADSVTCTVTLPKGDATVTTTVVKYGIVGLIANQAGKVGEDLSVPCVSDLGPEGVISTTEWSRVGGDVPADTTYTEADSSSAHTKSMVLSGPEGSDSGAYKCTVTYTNSTDSTELGVSEGSVNVVIRDIQIDSTTLALADSTVPLTCSAIGLVQAEAMDWYYNGVRVTSSLSSSSTVASVAAITSETVAGTAFVTSTSVLTLSDLERDDTDGSMQCKVTYGTGAEVTVLESSLMTLTVLGFIEDPADKVTAEGSQIYLLCRCDYLPYPSVEWEKDGVEIDSRYYTEDIKTSGDLTYLESLLSIPSSSEENDEGAYRCKAIWASTSFLAGGTVYSGTGTVSFLSINTLTASSSSVYVGDSVTLTCNADYDADAYFEWFHRGFEKSIEDSAGRHLVDTNEAQSTYSIASVGMMHSGEYECNAIYTVGESSLTTEIEVLPTCTDLIEQRNMALTCVATNKANKICTATCDSGYTYGNKSPYYKCASGVWKHYGASNPYSRVTRCSKVVPALDKTLNRRRLISAYPASTCKYLPNIKCSFDQFLAPLTCVLSGDCEIVSAYSRCGGGGAGGNRLTLFYAVKQIQNLATKSIWTTLQSEINSLNFGNFPGQPAGCD